MGACASKKKQEPSSQAAAPSEPATNNVVTEFLIKELARDTYFTVNEVEALYELFKRVSNSLVEDGLIHKEEFCLALFKNAKAESLFANRVFDVFDQKKNNVIEFGEFVLSLSVFHPKAPLAEKAEFAFRIYDLGSTGSIERSEIRTMLAASLKEETSALRLPEAALERIIDQTFSVAARKVKLSNEDRLGPEEWLAFCVKMPSVLSNMTLPMLRELTTAFPSFCLNTVASAGDLHVLSSESDTDLVAAAAAAAAAAADRRG